MTIPSRYMKYQVLSSCYSGGIVLAKGKTMKNFGYIIAGPSEFLIHQRFGKIRRQGREIGFLCLPTPPPSPGGKPKASR